MSDGPPILYAYARAGDGWRGAALGLEPDASGALELARLPGSVDGSPVVRPLASVPALGGLAVSARGAVAEADAAAGIIEVDWPGCATLTFGTRAGGGLGGPVRRPGPLAWVGDDLFVIDSADGRIRRLDGWTGALIATWPPLFAAPRAIASDGEGRLLVLDGPAPFLHRLDADGSPDAAFRAAVDSAAGDAALMDPVAVTVGAGDWVLVADGAQCLLAFDAAGAPLGPLARPAAGAAPGPLIAGGDRLFVLDHAAGRIAAMAARAGHWLGSLPDWYGAAAALALAPDGALWIKPDAGLSRLRFDPDVCHAAAGSWSLGPLDAGEDQTWHRLRLGLEAPAGTRARFLFATADASTPAPAEAEYRPALGPDCLLFDLPPEDLPAPPLPPLGRRWLWLRAALATEVPRQSPRLPDVVAATRGGAFLDRLPGFYGMESRPGGLFDRLCDVIGLAATGPRDAAAFWPAAMAPRSAPAERLEALAALLDTVLPAHLSVAERRRLLSEAVARHLRRGTVAGIEDEIATETGIAASLRESYLDRRIWRLDCGWGLGFDTALPGGEPDDPTLGGSILGEPCPIGFPASLANTAVAGPTPGYGAALFADAAYRFMAIAPSGSDAAALAAVAAVAGRERPAHALYGTCAAPEGVTLGAGLGLGLGQGLRLGAGPAPTALEDWQLGRSARLTATETRPETLLTLDGTPLGGGQHGG